jgi:hypothetical protein
MLLGMRVFSHLEGHFFKYACGWLARWCFLLFFICGFISGKKVNELQAIMIFITNFNLHGFHTDSTHFLSTILSKEREEEEPNGFKLASAACMSAYDASDDVIDDERRAFAKGSLGSPKSFE